MHHFSVGLGRAEHSHARGDASGGVFGGSGHRLLILVFSSAVTRFEIVRSYSVT